MRKQNKYFQTIKKKNGKIKYIGNGGGENIPVDLISNIPPENQASSAFDPMVPATFNGGLYAHGPQFNGPWGNIPGPATTDFQINKNLRSAAGPVDSLVQYPGTGHVGNNYQAMNGINWYNDTGELNPGQFQLQGPNCNIKQVGGTRKKKKNKKKKKKSVQKGGVANYPIDLMSNIPPSQQASSPFTAMPPPDFNAGLYANGPQYNGPWGAIPVTPTTQGYTDNFKSAVPPPGAELQMPGTARLGNNYQAMVGVNWYNNTGNENPGQFQIQCVNGGKKNSKRVNKKNYKKSRKQNGGTNQTKYIIQTTSGSTPESNAHIQKLTQLGANNKEQASYDSLDAVATTPVISPANGVTFSWAMNK